MKFFKCNKCGQLLISVNEKSEEVTCCGEKARLLRAGEVDGALEKHIPAYTLEENKLDVRIGEVAHPMEEDHYIEFVVYEYNEGFETFKLKPGAEPRAIFVNKGPGTLYEYCNKHGLWKKDVE